MHKLQVCFTDCHKWAHTCIAWAPRTSWHVLVLKCFSISTTRRTTSEESAGKKLLMSMYSDSIFTNIKPLERWKNHALVIAFQHQKMLLPFKRIWWKESNTAVINSCSNEANEPTDLTTKLFFPFFLSHCFKVYLELWMAAVFQEILKSSNKEKRSVCGEDLTLTFT